MNINLSQAIRYYIRYVLQIPSIYRPSAEPHVFLFSSRRSGSTLLRDAIYSLPWFNYIDQPFDHWQYNPHNSSLSGSYLSQVISPTSAQLESLDQYLNDLLCRKRIIRSQWKVWDPNYQWIWSRYVVKILNAKALIPWFEEKYSDRALVAYSTRHPIPTSLSIMRRGWGLTAQAYIENDHFRHMHLTGDVIDECRRILSDGTRLEQFVVNWCLENLVPLKLWREKRWFTISYERLVAEPNIAAQRIASHFTENVNDTQTILNTLQKPTRSTDKESRQVINEKGAKVKLRSWFGQVNKGDILRCNRILKMFAIDLYDANSIYPDPDFDSNWQTVTGNSIST